MDLKESVYSASVSSFGFPWGPPASWICLLWRASKATSSATSGSASRAMDSRASSSRTCSTSSTSPARTVPLRVLLCESLSFPARCRRSWRGRKVPQLVLALRSLNGKDKLLRDKNNKVNKEQQRQQRAKRVPSCRGRRRSAGASQGPRLCPSKGMKRLMRRVPEHGADGLDLRQKEEESAKTQRSTSHIRHSKIIFPVFSSLVGLLAKRTRPSARTCSLVLALGQSEKNAEKAKRDERRERR